MHMAKKMMEDDEFLHSIYTQYAKDQKGLITVLFDKFSESNEKEVQRLKHYNDARIIRNNYDNERLKGSMWLLAYFMIGLTFISMVNPDFFKGVLVIEILFVFISLFIYRKAAKHHHTLRNTGVINLSCRTYLDGQPKDDAISVIDFTDSLMKSVYAPIRKKKLIIIVGAVLIGVVGGIWIFTAP